MSLNPRCFLILSLAAMLGACSTASGGGATPAAVADRGPSAGAAVDAVLDSAPDVGGGHFVFQKTSMRPDANAPAILINFVTDGPNQRGVPCINCVNGASSSDNVGLTGPSSYVLSNFVWQYEISFTDISYKGNCKLAWAITAGKKTVDSFSHTLNIPSAGGFVLYAIARNRPKYSGPATLTGKVTCGKTSQSLHVPLQFQ
jgi:hypothetical protein